MAARRCCNCSTNWPTTLKRPTCPECEGRLDTIVNETPIEDEETARRVSLAEFERFYGKRETEREERGDLSPEVLGRLEARREYLSARKAAGAS